MATTKTFDSKSLPKPIIMPKNPARGHMPYALAVADDQAARDRAEKLDAYEKELKKKTDAELQAKADQMIAEAEAKKKAQEPVVEPKVVKPIPVIEETPKVESPVKGRKKKSPFEK